MTSCWKSVRVAHGDFEIQQAEGLSDPEVVMASAADV